jgi:hypothetical protein
VSLRHPGVPRDEDKALVGEGFGAQGDIEGITRLSSGESISMSIKQNKELII